MLMKVGRLGRVRPSLGQTDDHPTPQRDEVPDLTKVAEVIPDHPCVKPLPGFPASVEIRTPHITNEKLRAFLNLPALAA